MVCGHLFPYLYHLLTFVATQMQFRMKGLNRKEISVLTAVYIFSQNGRLLICTTHWS
jgi:hypothetical protein